MTSVARVQFDRLAAPRIQQSLGDPHDDSVYEDDDGNTTRLAGDCWWTDELEESYEDDKGNLTKMTTAQVTVINGRVDVTATGTFRKSSVAWDVDTREGRGVIKTATFTVAHVKRRDPRVRSGPGKRFQ